MLKIIFSLILILNGFIAQGQTNITKTIIHDSITRDYKIYIPKIYNPNTLTPLVFNLHGYASNNVQQEFYGDFRPIADTANFIIVHPNGTKDPLGNQFWNVGFFPSSINDVGFIEALIDTISLLYSVDPTRIYSTGMSNGGFMSHELACQSTRFAAIASVAGSMTKLRNFQCRPSKLIPILQIHGTADSTVPYLGTVSFLPIDTLIKFWATQLSCESKPNEINSFPDINRNDGSTAIQYKYNKCLVNNKVELIKVENGAHTWPGAIFNIGVTCQDFSASKEIWRFFSQSKLQTTTELNASNFEFNLLSNPVYHELIIKIPSDDPYTICILDFVGRNHGCFTVNNTFQKTIPIEELEAGCYILNIRNGRVQKNLTFIKS
ncbi:MAG: hypothetical protein LKG19_04170 [Saprospiraceae bacterium]|jgi:polyhydroxybutyrate depolymerase|nr:hypothetical protein [Saprospiraceae bacterium]